MRSIALLQKLSCTGRQGRHQQLMASAVAALLAAAIILNVLGTRAAGPYFVSPLGNDANSCTSMTSACLTIGSAISRTVSGDIVVIAGGSYTENLTIDKSLTLIGFGSDQTIIDGGYRGIWAITVTAGATVNLADLSILHGQGGIWNQGELKLNRVAVSHNRGSGDGGAISNDGAIAIVESVVHANVALYRGGGIFNRGVAAITDTEISENEGVDTAGGIYNAAGSVTLHHSTIISNKACGFDPYPTPLCTLAYGASALKKPQPSILGLAGGIANDAVLTATDTLITANRAFNWAGGIDNRGQLALFGVTLGHNYAQHNAAGAILNRSGALAATNVTFSDNTGYPGLDIYVSGGAVSVTNVTISTSITGSSIIHGADPLNGDPYSGTIAIHNTIVANSTGIGNCAGPIVSLGHNLDSGSTCGFTATGDLTNTNPLLGPLQDNGGPTPTYAIRANSPAVNAGDNVGCPLTDQRGVKRPQAGRCDIGAYEYVFPVGVYLPFVSR